MALSARIVRWARSDDLSPFTRWSVIVKRDRGRSTPAIVDARPRDGPPSPVLSSAPLVNPRASLRRAAANFFADPWRAAAAILAAAAMITTLALVIGPWFRDTRTFGFHDWDVQASHRYLVLLSLFRYHEFPSWNPFACGGFPAWGYVEADTIVVSPFLPAYLVLPLALALRIEVLGMAAIGAVGAYAATSRFTTSHAARALTAVIWAVNGRWALQAASGHTWHLAYAWLPWCLFFFERARGATIDGRAAATIAPESKRILDFALGGACIAMLVYSGGIYPLPHTVLVLGVYALLLALLERSPRPLVVLAMIGLLGVGLAAPKLLPLIDGFRKAPRLIESSETMDLGALWTMLTSRDQAFSSRPARVTPYGWHEWGIYVGTIVTGALVLGVIFVQGRREAALKGLGILLVVLGFGAFHPDAPWTLLHQFSPVFRSQHVPSRFLYPAILILGLVVAAGIGRAISKRERTAPWLDAAAAVLVLALGVDIGLVARKPMEQAMWMVAPDNIPQGRPFHFEAEPPFQYKKRDWAGPMYLAMLGNTGVINCYGAPPFDRKGAIAVKDARYKGEVHVEGEGTAKLVAWTPNHVVIDVDGATPSSLLVYNMNFDEGWSSDAGAVVPFENAVATRLPAGSSRVTLRYRPPYLCAGLLLGVATLAGLALAHRRARRDEEGR
jgi:hypothetical protein